MAQFDNRYQAAGTAARSREGIDEGLRAYMLLVYNYMAIGIALTGVVSYVVFAMAVTGDASSAVARIPLASGKVIHLTQFGVLVFTSPLKWVLMLAPLGLVFLLSARVHKMSLAAAQATFWIFSAMVGGSLASIFLIYTHNSIAQIFFITAATFGALSLYGYTTKKDLSGWGTFLFMGLIGIIIASVVNWFLQSPALMFAISVIGVLVFAGLTAYDTQRIKEMYSVNDDGTVAGRKAIMGALSLYLNFLNMFIMLLHLFGSRE
jgi:FtsH-binding integral membrane protein